MALKDRSTKAQEKFADHLMSISTGIFSATFLGVLVVPLSVFISSLLGTNPKVLSLFEIFERMNISPGSLLTFAILYLTPLVFAWYCRRLALGIYDRISKDAQT